MLRDSSHHLFQPKAPMDKQTYLHQLQELTSTMMSELYEMNYEQLEAFVEERQMIVNGLVELFAEQPPSAEEKNKVEELLGHDHEIIARMNVLRLEAQDWLHKRGQAKTQRNAYETNYAPDSFLMDKKK